MKTRTKIGKGGVFAALTAALLVTTVLITSCGGPSGGTPDGYTPPAGKGYVRLSVTEAGRSVVPNLTFTAYDLSFQEYTDNTYGTTVPGGPTSSSGIAAADIGDPINLSPGFYKVTVTAYTGTAPVVATATGISAGFAIALATGTPVTIPVGPITTPGADVGIFDYSVNINSVTSTLVTFTMDITQITGQAAYGPTNINLATGLPVTNIAADVIPGIPTGFYYVDVALTTSDGTASIRTVLHIYIGQTSIFTYTFLDGQFIVTTGYLDGFSTNTDNKPTLQRSGPIPVADYSTVTLVKAPTPATTTITVTNAGSFDTIEWYCNSTTALGSGEGVGGTDGETLTITAGTAPFNENKTHLVTVVGTTEDGIPYSTYFYVSITP